MERLELVLPDITHMYKALEFRQEFFSSGEAEIHGGSLLDQYVCYEKWLEHIKNCRANQTMPKGWVPSTVYFAIGQQSKGIIGVVDIRHTLNKELLKYGGNIGYSIRPSLRGRGYAAQMLKLALERCKEMGITKVMISCDQKNIPSARTIERCGGVMKNQFLHSDGEVIQNYWISLGH